MLNKFYLLTTPLLIFFLRQSYNLPPCNLHTWGLALSLRILSSSALTCTLFLFCISQFSFSPDARLFFFFCKLSYSSHKHDFPNVMISPWQSHWLFARQAWCCQTHNWGWEKESFRAWPPAHKGLLVGSQAFACPGFGIPVSGPTDYTS